MRKEHIRVTFKTWHLVIAGTLLLGLILLNVFILMYVKGTMHSASKPPDLLRLLAIMAVGIVAFSGCAAYFIEKIPFAISTMIQWAQFYSVVFALDCYQNNWIIDRNAWFFIAGLIASWLITLSIANTIKQCIHIKHGLK